MSSPPQGSGQPYPPPYGGPVYYPPMNVEGMLTKMRLWVANAVALALIYLGLLIFLTGTRDANVLGFARFLAVSGGMFGALASVSGALGSKKTTDLQNLGLFIWAGLLLSFTLAVFALI